MTAPTAVRIQEILFANDFSSHSDHAFQAARALGEHFGARLHLFHVVHAEEGLEAARAKLEAFAKERKPAGEFRLAVAAGSPASEILKYAEREQVDLIVMGTHGRTGLAHVLLGSVAETVVRHAPCQVLTLRKSARVPAGVLEPLPQESEGTPVHVRRCLVCALPSEDLVCDPCKARIQAEVLHRKLEDEKAGR